VSARELRQLAKLVYKMSRRGVWLGGKALKTYNSKAGKHVWKFGPWPKGLHRPTMWDEQTWTLSPEVELGGHRLRVAVVSQRRNLIHIVVFVDDEIKYPGGEFSLEVLEYEGALLELWKWVFGEHWAKRIARIERKDGGRTGPIDRRDLLIAEARGKLGGPQQIEHPKPKQLAEPSAEAVAAAREVEELLTKAQ
jgi:hypothetical protein